MKIRNSFVSNSSSSSFILIANGDKNGISRNPISKSDGEYLFDYGTYDIQEDKFRFCMLQCLMSNRDYRLEEVLQEFCKKYKISYTKSMNTLEKMYHNGEASIDHQSAFYEDEDNIIRLFKDLDTLERFILCRDSTLIMTRD